MAEPLSLGQLGRVLLRYWILIVVGTLLGAVLAFGATRLMTPVYRATATQLVKGLPGAGPAASYEAAQFAVGRAKTYPSFVYNAGVLENVRNDLDGSRTLDQLRVELSAANPVGTPLLEISAVGSTPQEASDKANSAARHLARFITEIETVGNRSPISVELAVQAALPIEAVSPKTSVITALGALIGFVLATVAALLNSYLRFQRRSTFRRQHAVSWVEDEAMASPTPASPAVAAGGAAGVPTVTAAPVDGGTGVGQPLAQHESTPSLVPPASDNGQRSVELPTADQVPEDQLPLIEIDGDPTMTFSQAAAEPPPRVTEPAAVADPNRTVRNDLDDTVVGVTPIAGHSGSSAASDNGQAAVHVDAESTDQAEPAAVGEQADQAEPVRDPTEATVDVGDEIEAESEVTTVIAEPATKDVDEPAPAGVEGNDADPLEQAGAGTQPASR